VLSTFIFESKLLSDSAEAEDIWRVISSKIQEFRYERSEEFLHDIHPLKLILQQSVKCQRHADHVELIFKKVAEIFELSQLQQVDGFQVNFQQALYSLINISGPC
jgi:hypothetical protein